MVSHLLLANILQYYSLLDPQIQHLKRLVVFFPNFYGCLNKHDKGCPVTVCFTITIMLLMVMNIIIIIIH